MWDGGTEVRNIGKECGTGMFINHVEDTAGKRETANLYRYKFKGKGRDGGEKWNREYEKLSTRGCRAGKIHKKDVNEIPENARPCG